jgi:hypothetical protein
MNRQLPTIVILVIGFAFASSATAKEIMPMFGGVLIDGYDLGKDTLPKGTLSYNPETNGFKGIYRGLKMPALAEVRDRIHQILVRQQELSLPNTLLDSASKDIVVKRYSTTSNAVQNTATSDAPTTIQQN